jgi:uncharacterized membrane protein
VFESLFTYLFSGIITILLIVAGWLIKRDVRHIDSMLESIDRSLNKVMERLARGDEKFDGIERRLSSAEKIIDLIFKQINK